MRRFPGRLLVPLALSLAGCQDSTLVTLHGHVTLDGRPVPTGAVTLLPDHLNGRTASGIIAGGEFTVQLPPATYRVVITSPKVVAPAAGVNDPTEADEQHVQETIPARYNERSEMRVTIAPGMIGLDFDIRANGR
jgi:hypothetical protein